MSMEAMIIGSRTAPVEEVIKHNKNGLLVDFYNTSELADEVSNVLKYPERYKNLKKEARKTIVNNYDIKEICLPKQIKIVEGLL